MFDVAIVGKGVSREVLQVARDIVGEIVRGVRADVVEGAVGAPETWSII